VLHGDEYDAITTIADHVYLGFARYRRISRREVPIYVLQPVTHRLVSVEQHDEVEETARSS
jgi:hypothetical protein